MLPEIPSDEKMALTSRRLKLEAVCERHHQELWNLYKDPALHTYVNFSLEYSKQMEKFARWSRRISPTGLEVWLNWIARFGSEQTCVAHFQVTLTESKIATIGYLVAKNFHRQGIASEGLQVVIKFLKQNFAITEIQASMDSRNLASINLAKKLGLTQSQITKGKNGIPDEVICSLVTPID